MSGGRLPALLCKVEIGHANRLFPLLPQPDRHRGKYGMRHLIPPKDHNIHITATTHNGAGGLRVGLTRARVGEHVSAWGGSRPHLGRDGTPAKRRALTPLT